MGDIADALRRAREKEPARPESSADQSGEKLRDDSAETAERSSERSMGVRSAATSADRERTPRNELAPMMRAARLETVAQVARPPEASISPTPAPAPAAPVRPKRSAVRQALHELSERVRPERISLIEPTAPAAAASRRLAQQVKRQAGRRRMSSLVVTSPLGGDGKTTVSCNLAVSLARLDRSRTVCLVDLDLRRPRVGECLGLSVEVGVDELLAQKATLDEALMDTDEPGLSVLAPKRSNSAPEHLLASENLRRLLDALTRRFWMVVIDTPPVLAVADAVSVLDVADGCLLVVRAGKSPTSSVEQARAQLPVDKLLGCCLNFARGARHNEGYYGYGPRIEADASTAVRPEAAAAPLVAESDAR